MLSRRSVSSRLFVVAMVAGLFAIARPATPQDASPLQVGLQEAQRVDVVEAWPFVIRPKRAADAEHCASLGPDSIRVTEGGEQVDVVAVTRSAPLNVQVLMIDTSASMSDQTLVSARRKGRQAKIAAKQYVRWMLEDAAGRAEQLMVVTFDDDLIMQVPPTAVADAATAARLNEAIEQIRGGFGTALRDALYRLIPYLGGRDGRAAVILLSDGADHASLMGQQQLMEVVQQTDTVTLFPIGIGTDRMPRQDPLLELLAHQTGGIYSYLRAKAPDLMQASLINKFKEIRQRLKNQLYVSYTTRPGGGMTADARNTDRGGRVRRRLRIESLDRRCKVPPDGYRPVRTLTPAAARSKSPRPIAEKDLSRIGLPVYDQVVDGDPLIRYAKEKSTPDWADRLVELRVLPPHLAARNLEQIIHRWLLADMLPARAIVGGPPQSREPIFPLPYEMNGVTFLDLRKSLAEVVYSTSSPHRRRARARAAPRIRAAFRHRVSLPSAAAERQRLERELESVVAHRLDSLGPQDYQNDLAEWFGDVAARDLARRLEAVEANALLEGGVAESETVQRRWLRLHDWLSFPDRVRIVTPLELACDEQREVCGFYRIVLPRLSEMPEDLRRSRGKSMTPDDFEQFVGFEHAKISKHPFGLMLVRWLLGLPGHPDQHHVAPGAARMRLATELKERWRVVSVGHRPVPIACHAREDQACPTLCKRRVELELVARDSAEQVRIEVALLGEAYPEAGTLDATPVDWCEAQPEPVRILPECFTIGGAAVTLRDALRETGLPVCPG